MKQNSSACKQHRQSSTSLEFLLLLVVSIAVGIAPVMAQTAKVNTAKTSSLSSISEAANVAPASSPASASLTATLANPTCTPAGDSIKETETMVQLGKSSIPVRQWADKNIRPRAIVVALHGASRHSGTYQTLAEHLVSLGYLVVSPDLRGHGEWYFSKQATATDKVANWDKSTDDVVALLDSLRDKYPRLPIFCMGESTGAAVAIKAADRCPAVNGLILSAIGTRPCVHDVPNIVCDAFEGIFDLDKPLDVKDTIIKYSSDDERVRLNAGNDPLVKPMSARELLRTSLLLNHTVANAEKLPSGMPVLMLQGDKDEIVTASSARSVLRHIGSHEKEMLEFPYGHILLTTPFIHPDVMSKVSDWLGAKTAEQQTVLAGATHVDFIH